MKVIVALILDPVLGQTPDDATRKDVQAPETNRIESGDLQPRKQIRIRREHVNPSCHRQIASRRAVAKWAQLIEQRSVIDTMAPAAGVWPA